MKSTRAMYITDQDHIWNDIKKTKRRAYLHSAIWDFLAQKKELKDFLEEEVVRNMTNLIMLPYEVIRIEIAKKVPHKEDDHNYYDHHKIIAGTQLAILTTLPLRTVKTASISRETVLLDPHKYLDVVSLNSSLAIFIALDILKNWKGLSSSEFNNRENLVHSCLAQLANYCCQGKLGTPEQHYFPLFWCSMLWYAIEEILTPRVFNFIKD